MEEANNSKWLKEISGLSESQANLIEGLDHLMMMSHRGSSVALGMLLEHTMSCVRWLQSAPRQLRGEARENLYHLMEKCEEWPIPLPADAQSKKTALKEFDALPLAEKCFFKVKKSGSGRPAGAGDDVAHYESPSEVGKRIVVYLEELRQIVGTWTVQEIDLGKIVKQINLLDSEIEDFCYRNGIDYWIDDDDCDTSEEKKAVAIKDEMLARRRELDRQRQNVRYSKRDLSYPVDSTFAEFFGVDSRIIRRLRDLPVFNSQNSDLWKDLAMDLLDGSVSFRNRFVPQSWDEEARRQGENGKGRNAHARNKLKKVFSGISSF